MQLWRKCCRLLAVEGGGGAHLLALEVFVYSATQHHGNKAECNVSGV